MKKLKIGDKVYLNSNPYELGNILPKGNRVVIDVKDFENTQWVKIEDYYDWIDCSYFIKYI